MIINGDTSSTFSYIPDHIEYIVTELLKNAFRATAEAHSDSSSSSDELPPVTCTIARSPDSPVITLRIRDAAGGIPFELIDKVNSYAFTTVNNNGNDNDSSAASKETGGEEGKKAGKEEIVDVYSMQQNAGMGGDDELTSHGLESHFGSLAGLGFGLPLSKLHCEVSWGFSSHVQWPCGV